MSQPTERGIAVRTDDLVVLGEDGADVGTRVDWQSETDRMEAAEFLVATRAQQERRLRIARDLDTLRILDQPAS